jgi:teichuronic acid biosynthesis glycosyltransferase TuaC
MRVAAITQYFPTKENPWNGRSAYETLRCLAKEVDVEVFSPHLRYPALLAPKWRSNTKVSINYAVPDLITNYVTYSAVPMLTRALNGWSCFKALRDLLERGRYDAILSYWLYPDGFAAVKIGRKLGIPVFVKAIGSDINEAKGITQLLTKRTMQLATGVLTVSRDLASKIEVMGIPAQKITPILNGCDTSVFYPRDQREVRELLGLEQDGCRYLVYVGRLDVNKGLRELIDAMAVLPKSEKIKLLLVGSGPAQSELMQRVHQHQMNDVVRFVGAVPASNVCYWISAADVVVLPSYAEGCPNVVLESLASGRPVVASNVGGIPELLTEHSGILVSPRDTNKLSAALQKSLSKSWDAFAIARRSNRSWDDVAQDVLTLLRTKC